MEIPALTKSDFNVKVISNPKDVLVLFAADWCGPCRALRPVLEELGAENKLTLDIFLVDTNKNYDLAARYTIKALPTVILFRSGQEIDRFWGLKTKDFIKEMLAG